MASEQTLQSGLLCLYLVLVFVLDTLSMMERDISDTGDDIPNINLMVKPTSLAATQLLSLHLLSRWSTLSSVFAVA
jgi:hypothetical protein